MLSGTATAALTISIGAMLAQAKLGPAHETGRTRLSKAQSEMWRDEMRNAKGGLVEANNLGNGPVEKRL